MRGGRRFARGRGVVVASATILAVGACRDRQGAPRGEVTTTPGWVVSLGGAEDQELSGVALDRDGVVVVGTFYGAVETPTGVLRSQGYGDVLVARVDGRGQVAWARALGSPKADFGWAVAAGADGAVIAIEADGTIDVDGARTRTPAQEAAGFDLPILISLDEAGRRRWLSTLASEEIGAMRTVASRGDAIVAGGRATGRDATRDLGAGEADCDQRAAVVGRWDASGRLQWTRCGHTRFGVTSQLVEQVAIAADDDVVACGQFAEGPLAFDGTDEVEAGDDAPALFVVRLGAAGTPRWLRGVDGQTLANGCGGVAVAADGTALVASNADGRLGGVELPGAEVVALSVDGATRWVASVRQALGEDRGRVTALALDGDQVWAAVWAKRRGVLLAFDVATGARRGEPIELGGVEPAALAAGDRLYVAGRFAGDATILGRALQARGEHDAVVLAVPRPGGAGG
ncbi:MAG: hypothetical protein H6708_22725 [Kofleriaceae bacterium]|nr:hypothetical protein [Kofleriaceae bacterium]